MFISKVIVVFVALLVSSAVTAPVFKEPPPNDLELSVRSTKHMAEAVHVARQIKNNLRPKAGEAVFWSGYKTDQNGKRVSVKEDAQKFAQDKGKLVLNHGLARDGINIPPPEQNPHTPRLWKFSSKVWAQRAHGDTHAVVGDWRNPHSDYDTIEKPILRTSPKVSKLTEHNVQTGVSTVVK